MSVSEHRLKILLVDDHPENLYVLKQVLKPTGLECVECRDGQSALAACLNHTFVLAILDVQMAGMDGYELAQIIRSDPELGEMPIIFLSAVTRDDFHIFKGYDSGAVDFVSKPFNPSVLLTKVQVFCRLARQRQELEVQAEALREEVQQRKRLEALLRESNRRLAELAAFDGLTGLHNRRAGTEFLESQLALCGRGKQDVSVLLLDLDFFKAINDKLGHSAGDAVLVEVSRRLSDVSRRSDCVVRWGGEEFLMVCPHTNADDSCVVADRILAAIGGRPVQLPDGTLVPVTASLGVATHAAGSNGPHELIVNSADKALYRAKATGRNRYEVATPPTVNHPAPSH